MCALWSGSNFTYNASSLASAYILAAFTIEVYMAIAHPVRHKNVFNHRLVALMVTAAWMIGIAYTLGIHLGIARVINGSCYGSYGWSAIALPVGVLGFFVRMIFPIAIYGVFYSMTFSFLKHRARVVAVPTISMTTAAIVNSSSSSDQY